MTDETQPNESLQETLRRSREELQRQIEQNRSNNNIFSETGETPLSNENPQENNAGSGGNAFTGTGETPLPNENPQENNPGGENPPAGPLENNSGEENNAGNGGNESQETVFDGISHAYTGAANPLESKAAPQKGSHSNWPKPPKNDSKIKAPSGDTFAEMVWNELLSFYTWVIDGTVDLALDFVTFVLYPQPGKINTDNEEAKDIFTIGNREFKKWKEAQQQNKETVINYHKEVLTNLERKKIGAPLLWNYWNEQPECFDNLFALYTEAEENPQSEAAKKIKKFKNFPQFVDKMTKNSEKVGHVCFNLATMKEQFAPGKRKTVAERINQNAKAEYENIMTNINKIKAEYQDNPTEMKDLISRYFLGIADALNAGQDRIIPLYNGDKKIKKRDKAIIAEKFTTIDEAINNFVLRQRDGSEKKISEIAAPENGNIRIPVLNVQETNAERPWSLNNLMWQYAIENRGGQRA